VRGLTTDRGLQTKVLNKLETGGHAYLGLSQKKAVDAWPRIQSLARAAEQDIEANAAKKASRESSKKSYPSTRRFSEARGQAVESELTKVAQAGPPTGQTGPAGRGRPRFARPPGLTPRADDRRGSRSRERTPARQPSRSQSPSLFQIDQPDQGEQVETRTCFRCGRQGHIASNCAEPKMNAAGARALAADLGGTAYLENDTWCLRTDAQVENESEPEEEQEDYSTGPDAQTGSDSDSDA
jgi:hypothetical protein